MEKMELQSENKQDFFILQCYIGVVNRLIMN